jgi:hypothetical protein
MALENPDSASESTSTKSDSSSALSSDSEVPDGATRFRNLDSGISELLGEIHGIITRLQRLSTAIKKASKQDRANKVAKFEPKDKKDIEQCKELRQHAAWYLEHLFPSSEDALRNRLIAAIMLRRKRFLYLKDRRERGRIQLPPLSPEPPSASRPVSGLPGLDHINLIQKKEGVLESANRSNKSAMAKTQNTVSAFDENQFKPDAPPSRQPAVSVRSRRQDEILDWPAVPRQSNNSVEHECPYCYDFLEDEITAGFFEEATTDSPREEKESLNHIETMEKTRKQAWKKARLEAWRSVSLHFGVNFYQPLISSSETNHWVRNHIKKDLEPYNCYFDQCQDPIQTFPDFIPWFEHVRDLHLNGTVR